MAARSNAFFWWGVATTLGCVYVYQKVAQKWGQADRRRTRQGEGSTAAASEEGAAILDRPDLELRLIRKAEAVVRGRTSALVIVVERCTGDFNYSAILRTAEALGIQHCYIIDPPPMKSIEEDDTVENMKGFKVKLTEKEAKEHRQHRLFAQNATEWLTITECDSVDSCVTLLRNKGYAIWVTDLSQEAVPLTQANFANDSDFPSKVAIVMGTEAVGCSQEMLRAADCRIYLPLTGFADSLNLSVATALVVQQVMHLHPHYVASMSEEERQGLREVWFPKLARQRLLTSGEKKERKRLQQLICNCHDVQNQPSPAPTKEQLAKIAQLPEFEAKLACIEAKLVQAEAAVQELVLNPPAPLTDARRCDDHRVTFVSKGTRKHHADHWKDMVATSSPQSVPYATAAYFRRKVQSEAEDEAASHVLKNNKNVNM